MNVSVCIGSACHLKGSYEIMRRFRDLVEQHGLQGQVAISPAFCLGHCRDGVTIQVDDAIVTGVSLSNAEQVFGEHILSAAR